MIEKPVEGIPPVQIIVAGATNTGKSTVSQIIAQALAEVLADKGFSVTLKDEDAPLKGPKLLEKCSKALQDRGCPIKVMTLQLGRAGLEQMGSNIESRHPGTPLKIVK